MMIAMTHLRLMLLGLLLTLVLTATGRADMPTAQDVWMFVDFEGQLEPDLPAGKFRQVNFSGPEDAKPVYAEGKSGQAIKVQEDGGFLDVRHGRADFPVKQGSLAFWYRPTQELDKSSRWLVFGSWAAFDVHLAGDVMLAYVTSNHRQFLKANLKDHKANWKDQWHLIAMTWDDGNCSLYVDGKKLATLADVQPVKPPTSILVGALPKPREPASPFVAIANDDLFDELTILSKPLTDEQVVTLYEQGLKKDYAGMLSQFGGAVSVHLSRHGYVRGEEIVGEIRLSTTNKQPVELYAIPEPAVNDDADSAKQSSAASPRVLLATLPAGSGSFKINTNHLRPGLYRLRAQTADQKATAQDNTVLFDESQLLGIRAQRTPEFPIGIDSLPAGDSNILRLASSWHLDHTSAGGNVDDSLFWNIDRLFTYGLGYAPCMNVHNHRALPLPDRASYFDAETGRGTPKLQDEVLQELVHHGDMTFTRYSSSIGSPFSPVGRVAMKQRVTNFLKSSQNHPGLVALSFDDEYTIRIGKDRKANKIYYGGYSKGARDYFTKQTGLQPSFPPVAAPGTVFPDDLPYFAWMNTMGLPGDTSGAGLSMNWTELTKLSHSIRPDVMTTTWSGGEYGEVDAIMDYGYPMIWQPKPGFALGHGRMDVDYDSHRSRQLVTPRKPIWGLLGWWSDDMRDEPDFCVADFRLNTIMALAKGAQSITWFTAYDPVLEEGQFGGGILSRKDLRDEMIHWADWIHQFGPIFKQLEVRPSRRVAVLISEENTVGMLHRGQYMHRPSWLYPALRVAGVPVDVITDRQIKAGELDAYDALVLSNFQYASQSLWNRIEAFSKTQGKQVFVDKSTALKPKNAIDMQVGAGHGSLPSTANEAFKDIKTFGTRNMAWMAQQLRQSVTPLLMPAEVNVTGSDLVAPFWLHSRGGSGRLLVLTNYDMTRPQRVDVTLNADDGLYVVELETGEVIGQSTPSQPMLQWSIELPAAGAKMYWVVDHGIGNLKADARYENQKFVVNIQGHDGKGQPVSAPLPVKVEWIAPDGKAVAAYEQFVALSPATGSVQVTLPRADKMDVAGRWQVRVTALTGGQSVVATVDVK